MSSLTRVKEFPRNFSERVVKVLDAMSFGDGLAVLGSAGIRSQQYAADYDGYEIVETDFATREAALKSLAHRFQTIIQRVKGLDDVWLGDIKAGVCDKWRVVPQSGKWTVAAAKAKVRQLKDDGIIDAAEEKEAMALLAKAKGKAGRIAARDGIKFHIIRWTPREIAAGHKQLRDGSTVQLWEAMGTPGLTKIDVIAWLGETDGFTDLSAIYEFRNKGTVLNPAVKNVLESLHESLILNLAEGNYFKAIKRMYSIAKYEDDEKRLAALTEILNSDLGRMYQIVSDIETIVRLLDEHKGISVEDLRDEIDGFVARLANIYTIDGYIRAEPRILEEIHRILRLSPTQMRAPLAALGSQLDGFLQKYSKRYVEAHTSR